METTTNTRRTETFTVTFRGRTAEVTYTGGAKNLGNSDAFACRIGRGEKLYRAFATAWPMESEEEARRLGYRFPAPGRDERRQLHVGSDGSLWGLDFGTTVARNRTATIVGWAADYAGTSAAAAHRDGYTLS